MKKLFFTFVAVAVLSGLSLAQVEYPGIYGTVVLADGSMIPGVTVTLTDNTGVKQTTVTSEEGSFRFLRNAPGEYELRFELDGFKTVIRKGIRLYLGKNVSLTVAMETTIIKEEVIVTAKASIVDVRKTTVSKNITAEQINSLPTSRNAWTLMSLVPGMMMDRVDVGGAESGQQSTYSGLGAAGGDSTWNVDGANVTDVSALGSSPMYFDVNSYEEMQVTESANDIGTQTGGVQINFVTKKAGNRVGGGFHIYMEDKSFELADKLPQNLKDLGYVSPGIQRLYQYGVDVGGPIVKDKLWWMGSWGIQDIHARTQVNREDATWLVSGYAKANFRLGNTSGDFHITYDNKLKFGRTALDPTQQAVSTTWDQKTPNNFLFGSISQILGNMMLTVKAMKSNAGFELAPKGSTFSNGFEIGPPNIYYTTPIYMDGSYQHYFTNRKTTNLTFDGNYFAEKMLGGDHEIRFGVDYYNANTTSQTVWPSDYRLRIKYKDLARNTGFWDTTVQFYTDAPLDVNMKRYSFYVSDTASFGKLVVNLGLRYDIENGMDRSVNQRGPVVFGQKVFTEYIGDNTSAVCKGPNVGTFSPRLSLSYDITGDGKNVVKLSLARYSSQAGLGHAYWMVYTYGKYIRTKWNDNNNNWALDPGEWSTDPNDWFSYNFDPTNPYTKQSNYIFDPNYSSPILDELTVSFEKILAENLSVSVNGFYKKYHNLNRNQGAFTIGDPNDYSWSNLKLEDASNWEIVGYQSFPNGYSVPVYDEIQYPNVFVRSNYSGKNYQRYMALQLVLSKKLSNKWMADVSFTYQDHKQFWDKNEWDSTFNNAYLNNFDFYNGGVLAPESSGSGYTKIYMNSRWMFQINGMYLMPWGLNLSVMLSLRDGYPYVPYMTNSDSPIYGDREIYTYKAGVKLGDDRLPMNWLLNLGIEKTFKLSDYSNVTLFAQLQNATNNNLDLKRDYDLDSTTYGNAVRVMNPGIFQFGIRVNF